MAAEITPKLVKELRERTRVGIMECKKSLVEANGDIELAISNLRKSGKVKAAKKAGRVANEGSIFNVIHLDYGAMVELNCETDFVAKSADFKDFGQIVIDTLHTSHCDEIDSLRKECENKRADLIAKVGENISIRRFATLKGQTLSRYIHGTRIGVIVAGTKNSDKNLMRQVAMHIAASNPSYLDPESVPKDVIQQEHQIQLEIAIQSGKSPSIAEKIVKGRMKKFLDEISLYRQNFIMDVDKKVGQVLETFNSKITGFIRFEVGEGIGKKLNK
jgi:elongation factor Ts